LSQASRAVQPTSGVGFSRWPAGADRMKMHPSPAASGVKWRSHECGLPVADAIPGAAASSIGFRAGEERRQHA